MGKKKAREQKGEMNEIIPGFLFLGSAKAARDKSTLHDAGITHVVCCAGQTPFSELIYHKCHFTDAVATNLTQTLPGILTFLGQAKNTKRAKVLVHCMAGMSRSATVVIAYLMSQKPPKRLSEAFAAVRSCRPQIRPNEGFVLQLIALEARLFGGVSSTKMSDLGISSYSHDVEDEAKSSKSESCDDAAKDFTVSQAKEDSEQRSIDEDPEV